MGKVHDYWKKINKVFAAACAVSLFISSHALAGIVESGELTEPSFWILNNNAGDSVVLDEEGIKQFNRKICDASLDVTEMSVPGRYGNEKHSGSFPGEGVPSLDIEHVGHAGNCIL